jgi:hypothetical protein
MLGDDLERLERLLASLESRRNKVLRYVADYLGDSRGEYAIPPIALLMAKLSRSNITRVKSRRPTEMTSSRQIAANRRNARGSTVLVPAPARKGQVAIPIGMV